tara:strand:+ start:1774 stop:3057 length:1284 start_codon:yes stop_codon:yes gene_type:complete
MRTLVVNVGELAHISRGDISRPLKGGDMSDKEQHVSEKGLGILIEGGIITKISGSDELISEYAPSWDGGKVTNEANVIDANGKAVIPGFVDSHTHLIWDGDRSNEISLRQKGMSYSEIASLGGGIAKTVRSTRQCSFQELIDIGINNVNKALSLGTTTLEAKSGYGLDLETEISILNAYKAIDAKSQCDIHSTWLGAHDVPSGVKKEDYVDELINEQLPLVSQMGIARWADVFCEPGWFTIEESREILLAAKTLGLESRVHVDEFVDSGGLLMASELGSVSADHVACSNDESRATADHAGVMQTFLPGTQYVLGMDDFPPIRDCLENSWAFSIATDFNPNCNSISMPFVGSLATHRCGIDPTAALVACTRNPATTFTDGSKPNIGVLMEGASASMNILNTERVDGWCQSPGMNPISLTIANGNIVKW